MKNTIKDSLLKLIEDRYLLVLSSVLLILAIVISVYVGFNVRPSELQLVSHCSAFGIRHLYTDQWFYLLAFGFFGFIVAAAHILLAMKILIVKGHSLAIFFAWLGIAVLILTWITAQTVINPINCWSA